MRSIGRGWLEAALMTEPMAWAAVMAGVPDEAAARAEAEAPTSTPGVVVDPPRTIAPVLLPRFWFGA